MNIIQIYQTNPFQEGQGGGVRYVKNLLNGIKDKCDEILFLGIGSNKENRDHIELMPITRNMTGYFKFLLSLIFKLPFMDLSKYDIVHVHRLYFAIPFILLKPKLKIVCSLHGRTFSVFESNYGNWKLRLVKPIFMFIEKFAIHHIDYLVPVSQDVIDSFEKKYMGFLQNKNMSIASPMIDFSDYKIMKKNEALKYFKLSIEKKYVGILGRLSDVKNIDFAIQLFHINQKYFREKNINFVIFGDGELKQFLANLIKQYQLSDLVVMIGEVNPYDIDKALACLEILLISSKHESGPIVMKEALLCGVPVVSNDVGEVRDYIINDKNGFIVHKNYNEYFVAIQKLLEKSISKEQVLDNSSEQLKKCSLEYVSNKYLEIYKKVLND